MLKKILVWSVLFISCYSYSESARWSLDSSARVAYLGGGMIKPPYDSKYRGSLIKIDFENGSNESLFESKYVSDLSLSNSGKYLLFSSDDNSLVMMDAEKKTFLTIGENVFGHMWSPLLNQFIYRTYTVSYGNDDEATINNAKLYIYDVEKEEKREVTGWVKKFVWSKHDGFIYADFQRLDIYDKKNLYKINPDTGEKEKYDGKDILFSPDGKYLLIEESLGEDTLPVKLSVADGSRSYASFTGAIKDKWSASSLTWLSSEYIAQSFTGYQIYSVKESRFIYRNMTGLAGKSIQKASKTAMAYGSNLRIVTYDYVNNDWVLENAVTGEEYGRINNTLFRKVDQCPRVRKGYTCETRKSPQIPYPERK